MIYFTADTHAYHQNIAGPSVSKWKEGWRDFKDQDEMTDILIKNINDTVKEDDVLYHLGDWSFGGKNKIYKFRKEINCKTIHLIKGNHDHHIKISDYWKGIGEALNFSSVQDTLEVKIQSNIFFLSHYAHRIWLGSHKGVIHLYGHSHGSIPDYGLSMDVGMDNVYNLIGEYRPLSFIEILSYMDNKKIEFPDHHNPETNMK